MWSNWWQHGPPEGTEPAWRLQQEISWSEWPQATQHKWGMQLPAFRSRLGQEQAVPVTEAAAMFLARWLDCGERKLSQGTDVKQWGSSLRCPPSRTRALPDRKGESRLKAVRKCLLMDFFSGKEHALSKRSHVFKPGFYPSAHVRQLTLPIAPGPGDPALFSGLCILSHTCTNPHTDTHLYTKQK